MKIQFIRSSEKKKILERLKEQFGITELPYLLIESGKEKIRAFTGHLSKEEILELKQNINIEIIGAYIIKKEFDSQLRLSFDATHLFKDQIKENIIEINEIQTLEWLKGKDLPIVSPKGIFVIQNKSDYLGCGKSSGSSIINHVPKNRRLKK